jgi:hypothetical protein
MTEAGLFLWTGHSYLGSQEQRCFPYSLSPDIHFYSAGISASDVGETHSLVKTWLYISVGSQGSSHEFMCKPHSIATFDSLETLQPHEGQLINLKHRSGSTSTP